MPTYRNNSTETIRVNGVDVLAGAFIVVPYPLMDSRFTVTDTSFYPNNRSNPIDVFTGLPIQMDDDHANVHNGIAYTAWNYGSIADSASLYIEFKTPDFTYVHLKRTELWGEDTPLLFSLKEAPTLTTGITAFTPINRERNSYYTSSSAIKLNPTAISGGTVIDEFLFGGGSGIGSNSSASTRDTSLEIVLKPDTTYLFTVTNSSGSTANISMWLYWYEEAFG